MTTVVKYIIPKNKQCRFLTLLRLPIPSFAVLRFFANKRILKSDLHTRRQAWKKW